MQLLLFGLVAGGLYGLLRLWPVTEEKTMKKMNQMMSAGGAMPTGETKRASAAELEPEECYMLLRCGLIFDALEVGLSVGMEVESAKLVADFLGYRTWADLAMHFGADYVLVDNQREIRLVATKGGDA